MSTNTKKSKTTPKANDRKAKSSVSQHTGAMEPKISSDLIRRRAYEIYEIRNGLHGDQVEPGDALADWLQAEDELLEMWEEEDVENRDRPTDSAHGRVLPTSHPGQPRSRKGR